MKCTPIYILQKVIISNQSIISKFFFFYKSSYIRHYYKTLHLS